MSEQADKIVTAWGPWATLSEDKCILKGASGKHVYADVKSYLQAQIKTAGGASSPILNDVTPVEYKPLENQLFEYLAFISSLPNDDPRKSVSYVLKKAQHAIRMDCELSTSGQIDTDAFLDCVAGQYQMEINGTGLIRQALPRLPSSSNVMPSLATA
jgi:hypothetical protein